MALGPVRRGVQRGERDVSEILQDFRPRKISDALQHARPVAPHRRQREVRERTRALEEDRGHGARRPQEQRHQLRRGAERSGVLRAED